MLQSIENIKLSSYVQCRWLNTFTLTHFLAKTIFPEGMGGVQNSSGNSGGVGGSFYWSKNGNSGEEGGLT